MKKRVANVRERINRQSVRNVAQTKRFAQEQQPGTQRATRTE